MTDLPNWVYDVVIAMERWRYTHPKLHAQYAGSDEWQPVDDCGCGPLDLVPADVCATAKAIKTYLDAQPAQIAAEPFTHPETPGNTRTDAGGEMAAAT